MDQPCVSVLCHFSSPFSLRNDGASNFKQINCTHDGLFHEIIQSLCLFFSEISLLQNGCILFWVFLYCTSNVYFRSCAVVVLKPFQAASSQETPEKMIHISTLAALIQTHLLVPLCAVTDMRERPLRLFYCLVRVKSSEINKKNTHTSASTCRVLRAAALTGVFKLLWLSVRRL